MIRPLPDGPTTEVGAGSPDSVRRAQRFLEIVDVIAVANRPLQPKMPEKQFRAMVIRMAEHQLLYEEYQVGGA